MAARMAERWYERLSRMLDHTLSRRQPLILYSCHPHFEQTKAISGDIGEGTGGVTEFLKRRVVLPLAGSLQETDHVIGHELVHAFQIDITGQGRSGASLAGSSMAQLPLWFIEGMAEYLSVGPVDPHTTMWIRDAALANKLPTISQLYDGRYFPYRYGQALWAYLAGRFGDGVVGQALKAAARLPDAERAIAAVTGVGVDTLSREWHAEIRRWTTAVTAGTTGPDSVARRLVAGREDRRYNVGPALSPDGRWLVFLSERTLFSIEMFLADARTGRVVRRLTHSAIDPHVSSLQFIQSAGSFSPDGKRFAYASVDRGQPVLRIYEMDKGRDIRVCTFEDLGEIFHPTWSPDGGRIAFSGQIGGFTDLFTVDVATGRRTRLTDDPYSAIEPAWSPDGRSIAFVTDRFTTDLERLSYGEPRLALLDVTSGEVSAVPAIAGAKHINPQWTRDGAALHFVSDRGGISNVYRVNLADGAITQVTRLATGVSGVTALSPVISSARGVDKLVMTVYERGSHHLYTIESPAVLAGAPLPPGPAQAAADTLPPTVRQDAEVSTLIDDPALGLPAERTFPANRYKPGLSLDNVSNVGLGFGSSGNTVVAGGGATLYFSDMLGDHNLVTLLQFSNVGSDFANNISAGVGYYNFRSRWDWGLELSQFPVISRSLTVERLPTGEYVEKDFRHFQVERNGTLRLAYPFDRSRRVEFSGGYSSIDFSGEVEESIIDPTGSVLLSNRTYSLPDDSIPSLSLGIASLALVWDNSIFGGTSPIMGSRYRVEVAPTFGDLNFVGVLADFRKYIPLAGPLTLAGRAYSYGRYGRDAENTVLTELFLGYPWLVRGYDDQSFTLDECEGGTDDCPAFDRLFGSRLALGNAELRLPLIGGVGLIRVYGVPPIEVAGFFDVGAAWRNGVASPFETHGATPVSSHGVAMRMNLLGFAVAEVDYVRPHDRPRKGSYWVFSLQPGF